jgi:hypothetical protein
MRRSVRERTPSIHRGQREVAVRRDADRDRAVSIGAQDTTAHDGAVAVRNAGVDEVGLP